MTDDDYHGVQGGQGRSAEELWNQGVVIAVAAWVSCLSFIIACIVGACNAA